jgi:hypothetical protein
VEKVCIIFWVLCIDGNELVGPRHDDGNYDGNRLKGVRRLCHLREMVIETDKLVASIGMDFRESISNTVWNALL